MRVMGRGRRLRGWRLWLACGSGVGHGWLAWGWDERDFGRRGGFGGCGCRDRRNFQSGRVVRDRSRRCAVVAKGPGEPPRDKHSGDENDPDGWAEPMALAAYCALRLAGDFFGHEFNAG